MQFRVFKGLFLNFKDIELESGFEKQKQKFQITMLKFFVVYCLIASIVIWLIVNPFALPLTDPFIIVFNIGKVFLVIAAILVIKKYQFMVEKLWIAMLMSLALLIFENVKQNEAKIPNIGFLYWGLIAQIFLFSTILSRISWKYNLFMVLSLTIYLAFRFTDFTLNFSYRFFPFIIAVINLLFLVTFGYMNERLDRIRYHEIKAHENSLRCYKDLIKNVIPSSIMITSNEKILFCNEPTEKLLGKKAKDISFCDLLEIFIEKEGEENQESSEKEENQFGYSRSTKTTLLHLISGQKQNIVYDNNWKYFTALLNDRNLRTDSGQELENTHFLNIRLGKILWENVPCWMIVMMEDPQRLEYLKRRDKYKDKMLATVSHDLRTPLNGIIGMIHSVLESLKEKELRKCLKIALTSSHHLLSLINDILDFSQINNGKLRLNRVPFSLWKVLKEVRKLVKLQIENKGLKFLFENNINRIEDVFMVNDPTRLKQVLLNLLGNAIKFTATGFIKLMVEVEEEPSFSFQESPLIVEYNRVIKFSVEDSGCGIKQENIPKLFTIFGRIENEENLRINQTGIGLGLAISQKIVKHMNNSLENFCINVSSCYGKGTTFSFPVISFGAQGENVDLVERNSADLANLVIRPSITKFRRLGRTATFVRTSNNSIEFIERRIRILVVDDDQINVLVVTKYLSQMKEFDYDVVFNGKEALLKYSNNAIMKNYYDVILMDCNMPVMDGFEATERILKFAMEKQITPPHIIALTANSLLSDHQNCFRSGMVGFITKPFTKKELKEKISKVIHDN